MNASCWAIAFTAWGIDARDNNLSVPTPLWIQWPIRLAQSPSRPPTAKINTASKYNSFQFFALHVGERPVKSYAQRDLAMCDRNDEKISQLSCFGHEHNLSAFRRTIILVGLFCCLFLHQRYCRIRTIRYRGNRLPHIVSPLNTAGYTLPFCCLPYSRSVFADCNFCFSTPNQVQTLFRKMYAHVYYAEQFAVSYRYWIVIAILE